MPNKVRTLPLLLLSVAVQGRKKALSTSAPVFGVQPAALLEEGIEKWGKSMLGELDKRIAAIPE